MDIVEWLSIVVILSNYNGDTLKIFMIVKKQILK